MILTDPTAFATPIRDRPGRNAEKLLNLLPDSFEYIEKFRDDGQTGIIHYLDSDTDHPCVPGDRRRIRALIRKFLLIEVRSSQDTDTRRTIYRKRHPIKLTV